MSVEISEFVDSNEHRLRNIVQDLFQEEHLVKRFTRKQREVCKSYYIENKTDCEIADAMELDLQDVLDIQDSAISEIQYFAGFFEIKDILQEEDLVEKLKVGDERLSEYLKFFEEENGRFDALIIKYFTDIFYGRGNKKSIAEGAKKLGISNSEMREILRMKERKFFSKFYAWEKTKQYLSISKTNSRLFGKK